jgi:adenosyl cobinamide kinase/adenosyl cobinamide phosphate guanylyltransferase
MVALSIGTQDPASSMATQGIAQNPLLTLVIGGARSGKSSHAQSLARATPAPWVMIATAEALDAEMRERIALHKASRGEGWIIMEAPIDLAGAITQAPTQAPVVIDCLTLWLSNLMLGDHDLDLAVIGFETALRARAAPTILVANEVGLGIVPETPLGRAFRDRAGSLNQRLAARAGQVVLMVAGVPLKVKPQA